MSADRNASGPDVSAHADPTPDAFGRFDWAGLVASVGHRDEYARRLYDASVEAGAAGDRELETALKEAGSAASLGMRLDRKDHPFVPRVVLENFQSADIAAVSPAGAKGMSTILNRVDDPWLRARFADVAWVRARDRKAAEQAVSAYLALVDRHTAPDRWLDVQQPLERALQLSLLLGRRKDLFADVVGRVERLLAQCSADGDGFRAAHLHRLLLKYDGGDASTQEATVLAIAEHAATAGRWHQARSYFELAAEWAVRAKNAAARGHALLRVVDMWEAEAEAVLANPGVGHLQASGHLQHAIEAVRRVGGQRERQERLRARLLEIQRGAVTELVPHSHRIDVGEWNRHAEQSVTGRSLGDALVAFVLLDIIPNFADVRRRVEEASEKYLFMRLFPKQALDSDGKVIARPGSTHSSDPVEREAALRAEMVTEAAMLLDVMARSMVQAARRTIIREHALGFEELADLMRYHPLVAAGRELLVAEGLHAGFVGEFSQAIHLLVPQLEHSLRLLLRSRGVMTSTMNHLGLQEELNINSILRHPEVSAALGEDMVFAMQALLIEKFGPDIRNRMAHGLMDYGAFYSGHAIAAWWLMLRFAAMPLLRVRVEALRRDEGGEAAT